MISTRNKKTRTLVIAEYAASIPIRLLSIKYNVSKSTIYKWLHDEKLINKDKGIKYKDYVKLKRERDNAVRNLKIYEDLHCFKDSSIKEKQESIEKFVGVYPIKVMCNILNLPKGTFYNYHFRRKDITQYKVRDDFLKQKILEIYFESDRRFGAKKIEIKLRTLGINTTLHKVQTLMKLLNIKSTQKIKKVAEPSKDNSQYYVNKLKRLFNQDAPNKYWVSDVTEVRIGKNKFYLCVVLDLFSRKVIAYRLASQNNINLTVNTFKDAYESRDRPNNLSFHSDQGSNYTAYQFRDLLHSFKVNQSFSHSGNPYDNACMESFFSSFKREEYNSKHYEYFDELQASVDAYIKFYNDYRPHQTLKNKTPNEFETDYYKELDSKRATTYS